MTTNAALLNKIADRIEADPAHFDLGFWAAPVKDVSPVAAYNFGGGDYGTRSGNRYRRIVVTEPLPTCGTIACIAGWTIIESDPKLRRRRRITDGDLADAANLLTGSRSIASASEALLGLSKDDIFYPRSWYTRRAGRPTAKNVVKQLRLLAKGKGKFADHYVA